MQSPANSADGGTGTTGAAGSGDRTEGASANPPIPAVRSALGTVWWLNVYASVGTSLILFVVAVLRATDKPLNTTPLELIFAIVISPIAFVPLTVVGLCLVVGGFEAPTAMHLVGPIVYLALFMLSRWWLLRPASGWST